MAEEEKLLHYKWGGNPSHADISILPNGRDIEYIVINHIEAREDEKVNGVVKNVFVAVFDPNPYTKLPMVLNKKNKERILKMAHKGEFHLLTIQNLPVRLTFEETNIGSGLRISTLPPTMPKVVAPVKPAIPEEKFNDTVNFLKTKSMDELKAIFTVAPDMEKRLIEKLAEIKESDGPAGS